MDAAQMLSRFRDARKTRSPDAPAIRLALARSASATFGGTIDREKAMRAARILSPGVWLLRHSLVRAICPADGYGVLPERQQVDVLASWPL